jgi:hypothetical protein
VRVSYEWARTKRALFGFAPVLVIVAVAGALGRRPSLALAFGVVLFLLGAGLLWYGRDLKRAVLPGLLAGLAPLALVLCASHVDHLCTSAGCMMLCLPACAAGGLIAGLTVGVVMHRARKGPRLWIAASAVALLTGAMGCVCIGATGLAGLGLGYVAGALVPMALQLLRRQHG